jgi:hypothetical protein
MKLHNILKDKNQTKPNKTFSSISESDESGEVVNGGSCDKKTLNHETKRLNNNKKTEDIPQLPSQNMLLQPFLTSL